MPTSTRTAPGLIFVGRHQSWCPGGGDHDVGPAQMVGEVFVRVWHCVTVAFSVRRVRSSASVLADGDAASDENNVGTADVDLYRPQELDDAPWRNGSGAG